MEEDNRLEYPYYETTYFDDNNTKHITYLKNRDDIKFYSERFGIVSSEYVNG